MFRLRQLAPNYRPEALAELFCVPDAQTLDAFHPGIKRLIQNTGPPQPDAIWLVGVSLKTADMVELVYTTDLKSVEPSSSGFKSRCPHHSKPIH